MSLLSCRNKAIDYGSLVKQDAFDACAAVSSRYANYRTENIRAIPEVGIAVEQNYAETA